MTARRVWVAFALLAMAGPGLAQVEAYGDFQRHAFASWVPEKRAMIVSRGTGAAMQWYRVESPGATPQQVPAPENAPVSGKRSLIVQPEANGGSSVWVVDNANGRKRRVTRPARNEAVAYERARLTRDGRGVFALARHGSGRRHLVLIDLASGRERVLAANLKSDVDDYDVSFDVSKIAFVTREGARHVLRFLDTVTLKEQPRPPLFDGMISHLAWRPGASEVAFDIASARTAGDVFSYDVRANGFARWTNGNNPAVNTSAFPEPRAVRWPVAHGAEREGFLYAPPARFTGKRPVIVRIAEPGTEPTAGFIGRDNYFPVETGTALLYAHALDDLGPLLDWIARQPELDSGRVLVLGAARAKALAEPHATRIRGYVANATPAELDRATVDLIQRTIAP